MESKISIDSLLANTGDMALKRRANYILRGLDLKSGMNILDVGCGDGYYIHLLQQSDYKVSITGTDYDQKGLAKAKKNVGGSVPLVQGDLMKKIDLPDNTFDRVVMSEVVEHLPDDVRGLKEVARMMKPGAILCLTVPSHRYPMLWDPLNWWLEKLVGVHIKSGFFAGLWNQHERLYTEKQIKDTVERSGFTVISCESLTWWCLPLNHYLVNAVARLIASGKLTANLASDLSKYSRTSERKSAVSAAFKLVNAVDRLNDLWQPRGRGVSIYLKAVKK